MRKPLTRLQRLDMAQMAFAQMNEILRRNGTYADIRTSYGHRGTDNMSDVELMQHCSEMRTNYTRYIGGTRICTMN